MRSLLSSPAASALTAPELRRIGDLFDAYPIELAELTASPKQLEFQRAFFDRRDPRTGTKADIFAALGGNRSGKSYVCGWLCFARYLRYHARKGDWFWCVGQTLDRSIGGQQQELWKALPRWMFTATAEGAAAVRHSWRTVGQQWDEKIGFGMHRKVVLPTADGGKCLVEFRSADQAASTFEQAKLTGAWCDERLPEEIYNRLLPRLADRDGWLLYSDIPEQWWQYERLANAKAAAGVYFRQFAMHDNAHNLADGAVARLRAGLSEEEAAKRVEGEFQVMEGVVYKQYKDRPVPAGHLRAPFEIPADWPRWRVIDYGASAPTACLWIALSPAEKAYVYREYYQRGLSVQSHAKAILAMSGDERYRATLMDPHAVDPPPVTYGVAKTISKQYAEAGIPSTGWPFVQVMGEHAMVERVKARLDNHQIEVFDTCTNVRREFRSWKFKCDKEGRPLGADAYENDNNHTLDCIKGWLGKNPAFAGAKVEVSGGGE